MISTRTAISPLVALLTLVACESMLGPTGPELLLVSGATGSGAAGSVLGAPLVVEVRNHHEPTSNAIVRFQGIPAAADGAPSATLSASPTGTFATTVEARTDPLGRASVWVRLGTGSAAARVAVTALSTGVQDTARYDVAGR